MSITFKDSSASAGTGCDASFVAGSLSLGAGGALVLSSGNGGRSTVSLNRGSGTNALGGSITVGNGVGTAAYLLAY